jgi:1-acyl-sn-glycerol-3-phosphate acyltransferase
MMFKYLFWIVYRAWFYILVAIPIILLLPVLLFSIAKESRYPFFFKLAQFWAKFILIGMGFKYSYTAEQTINSSHSYVFVANHTSMADIMLMLAIVKNPFVFVGKKELAQIPLFGFFYRRTCILVDRNNAESRRAVFLQAQRRIKNGLSVCIFPEGGVPDEDILLDTFKDGAFRLAINHQIPVVPLTFLDNKKRFSYTFFSGGPGKMRAVIHRFIDTRGLQLNDTKELRERTRIVINNCLNKT